MYRIRMRLPLPLRLRIRTRTRIIIAVSMLVFRQPSLLLLPLVLNFLSSPLLLLLLLLLLVHLLVATMTAPLDSEGAAHPTNLRRNE